MNACLFWTTLPPPGVARSWDSFSPLGFPYKWLNVSPQDSICSRLSHRRFASFVLHGSCHPHTVQLLLKPQPCTLHINSPNSEPELMTESPPGFVAGFISITCFSWFSLYDEYCIGVRVTLLLFVVSRRHQSDGLLGGQPQLRANLRGSQSPQRHTAKSSLEEDLKKLITLDSPPPTTSEEKVARQAVLWTFGVVWLLNEDLGIPGDRKYNSQHGRKTKKFW